MQLIFYKGPAQGLVHVATHELTAWFTQGPYSHSEIIVGDYAYSSSGRDKGVRRKPVSEVYSKHPERWDLFDLRNIPLLGKIASEDYVLEFYERTKGMPYDYAGVARFVIPVLYNSPNRYYCSEWCSDALRLTDIDNSPNLLAKIANASLND